MQNHSCQQTFSLASIKSESLHVNQTADRPCLYGDHSPDAVKFPDNSQMMCVTPAHVRWFPYDACAISINVSDQTTKFTTNS